MKNEHPVIDTIMAYFIAAVSFLYAGIIGHSSEILTIGSIILLVLRVYVDGTKAFAVWRKKKDTDGS